MCRRPSRTPITIENIGDSSVSLDRIEDWLPTVGSSNPSDGFVYVDNSTSAYFNGTSDPVIFYDGFNRTDSNTVDYWTDGDGAGAAADCRVNTNRADLKLGCVITQSAISTDGYTNILFTYRWSGSDALSNRTLTVEWEAFLDQHLDRPGEPSAQRRLIPERQLQPARLGQ